MREREKKSEVSEGEGEEEAGEEVGEEKNNSWLVPYESDNDATFPQKSYSVALQSYACLLSQELSRVKRDSDLGIFLFPTMTIRSCGCKQFWLGRGGMENFPEKTIIRSQEEKECLTSKVSISFQQNVVETKDTLKE